MGSEMCIRDSERTGFSKCPPQWFFSFFKDSEINCNPLLSNAYSDIRMPTNAKDQPMKPGQVIHGKDPSASQTYVIMKANKERSVMKTAKISVGICHQVAERESRENQCIRSFGYNLRHFIEISSLRQTSASHTLLRKLLRI